MPERKRVWGLKEETYALWLPEVETMILDYRTPMEKLDFGAGFPFGALL